ncbi:Serpentine Receptor, class BC (Class B-like) [Caenorhabditis elegans]|uniref:Serpentine Receptor, class BC (Class B-like) n=1 Tax=Caenorhabditis elegans TaxID=6239 RepID=Q5F4V6_CAEEL|nr:Serpentine Receptor, class BC (Class B-like) [Caenorhabditis elegans]CCD62479.1 Serpentine Receptor, class BC (Class B-like) [Caenorhabditis elegans]|eukprot:NP_503970.2 Serpentine Receptor, class BC (class B-like) [Caenorhabditis elegans]
MKTIVALVCVIGIVCANIEVLLNANLVWKIVLKKSQRKREMGLFYYRFVLDVCFGLAREHNSFTIIFLQIKPNTINTDNLEFMSEHRNLLIYLGLPWSNIASCRSIVALAIAVERATAVCVPLLYRTITLKIPNFCIFLFAVAYGLFENVVLYGFCGFDEDLIPATCTQFGCAINKCFYNYFMLQRSIVFSINVFVSIVLSIKLLFWNKKQSQQQHKNNNKLSKANRLALLDTCTVFLFDFIPVFCGGMWPHIFSIEVLGPFTVVMKIIGCAIESTVVSILLKFGRIEKPKNQSSIAVTLSKNVK